MPRDDTVYLRHVLDAIARIGSYVEGLDEQRFYRSPLIQDGVIRQLEIIGEAVKHLSVGLRDRYPRVPWQDIAGTRDHLIHVYFGVDLQEVWDTVQGDLPSLRREVEHILDDIPQSDQGQSKE